MTTLTDHLRVAIRALRRAPGFSLMTIGLLALGVGATSAVFSAALAVIGRDLPIRDQNRVVALWATDGGTLEVPTGTTRYERFRKATTTLSAVAGFAHYGSNLVPLRDERDNIEYGAESSVTGDFFDVLGARPAIGRLLRADDDIATKTPAIVISEAFWRRTFAGDAGVIGRRLRILNRELTATIVGVAPAGLDYPGGTDIWVPFAATNNIALDMIAREAPGATVARVRAEAAAFVANDAREFPDDLGGRSLRAASVAVTPLPDVMLGAVRQPMLIFSLAAAALLLIACVNVGNLLLVRATVREHELGIRRALGARSSDLLMQLGAEATLLALFGGLLGGAVGFALLRALIAVAPAGVPRLDQVALSPVAVVISIAVTMLVVFSAGVIPSLLFGRTSVASLRLDARGGRESSSRRALRSGMVAAQIAIALVLLTVSGLLVRSLSRLENLGLGYEPRHLAIVQITTRFSKYTLAAQFNAAFDAVQQQFKHVPGVTAVSPVLGWPFLGANAFAAQFELRGGHATGAETRYVSWDAVGSEFFAAMSSPVLRGRAISDEDRENAAPVAVVTQDLAKLYWPGDDPLGKQLRRASVKGDTGWRTVVGVIAPLHYRELRAATPTVLFAYRQEFQQGIFVIRSTRPLTAILPELRRAASASDRDIALWRAESMDQVLAGPLSRPRFEAFLVSVFGAVAVFLAAAGLYGVTAYLVRQRTREFAIRVALGATASHILRAAFGDALGVALVGAVTGAATSVLGARLVAAQLFDLAPTDPVSLGGAGLVLIVVTLAAAFVPARRAMTRVDPVSAMRSE